MMITIRLTPITMARPTTISEVTKTGPSDFSLLLTSVLFSFAPYSSNSFSVTLGIVYSSISTLKDGSSSLLLGLSPVNDMNIYGWAITSYVKLDISTIFVASLVVDKLFPDPITVLTFLSYSNEIFHL